MNKIIYATIAISVTVVAQAQVMNPGFENWSNGLPEGWTANNVAALNSVPITMSSDAHSGSFSVRGEVLVSPLPTTPVVSPTLQTNGGAMVSSDPTAVIGWYKFSPSQSTTSVSMGATVIDINGAVTGIGTMQYTDAKNEWAQFSIPINYDLGPSAPAQRVTISFIIADSEPAGALGSWYLIDDVGFDGAQAIHDRTSSNTVVGMPYPSPFSNSTSLPVSSESISKVNVDVIDLLGRPVAVISEGTLGSGDHKLTWTPSTEVSNGIYFIRVSQNDGSIVRRVVLQR